MRRYGDILLNDGAECGCQTSNGLEYPVFDELAVLEPSGYSTFRVTIHADEAAKESLTQHCEVNNIGIEDWSTLRNLCPYAAEGNRDHPSALHMMLPMEKEGTASLQFREKHS